MIVIVGILAAIAVPMYTDYMRRARRADAKTALEQLRAAQEMRRAERGSYDRTMLIANLELRGELLAATVGDYTITWLQQQQLLLELPLPIKQDKHQMGLLPLTRMEQNSLPTNGLNTFW